MTKQHPVDGCEEPDSLPRARTDLPFEDLDSVLQVDYLLLSERLADIPEVLNAILKLVDGRRTLGQVLDDSDHDEAATMVAVRSLIRDDIVRVLPPSASNPPALLRAPRIVRYVLNPRVVTVTTAVASARLPRSLRAGAAPGSAPASAPAAAAHRRRAWTAIAAIVVLVAVATGVTAWALRSREPRKSGRSPAAAASRPVRGGAIALDPANAATYIDIVVR